MKQLWLICALTLSALLSACNGHSDDNGNNGGVTPVATTITLAIIDSSGASKQSFDKNETITLKATVFDAGNKVISGSRVNFSTDLGTLSAASKLTDSEGIAEVSMLNSSLAIGAGTITATIGEVAISADFEYVNNEVIVIAPSITTTMTLDGVNVNQFRADQQAQIISTLLDENSTPIANKIISYTADVGALSTTTALTNAAGIASVSLSSTDEGIGAGVITATYTQNDSTVANQFNYQIVSKDTIIDSEVRLGYFDVSNNFIEGKIQFSVVDNTISAGGTLGLSVNLVDNNDVLVTTPTPVSFTSNCVQNSNASIDTSVLSINGKASSTFADINCAGVAGTDDVIVASVTINGVTNTAHETINITGERLGSIEFISAEPSSIVLKGTGGQNKQENSTLTFKVKSDLGNVLAQQKVTFALDTAAGGITLSRAEGFTNSQGLITTQVSAGTVPTAVRVTAIADMTIGNEQVQVKSQSDILSINTGLPEQRSITIAANILNPEADDYNGEKSVISAWLADNFNNPVPDGTTVNFTTEGGQIQPSCVTVNGSCNVTWTSAEPRVPNHRITILATALGHETFFDTNGNNTFDDADGSAITDRALSSGFTRHIAETSGFLDMSEAWRDDNENLDYDSGETFIDYDNDKEFTPEDSLFNGPQCQGANCAAEDKRAIHVRKSLVLTMSGSFADFLLTNADGSTTFENRNGTVNAIPNINDGASQQFNFSFADYANQPMPMGTTISVTASKGTLEGTTSATVRNTSASGYSSLSFYLLNEIDGDAETSVIEVTITTPKGNKTSMVTSVNLL